MGAIGTLNDVYMIEFRNGSEGLFIDLLFWNKEKRQNTQTYRHKIQYGCAPRLVL